MPRPSRFQAQAGDILGAMSGLEQGQGIGERIEGQGGVEHHAFEHLTLRGIGRGEQGTRLAPRSGALAEIEHHPIQAQAAISARGVLRVTNRTLAECAAVVGARQRIALDTRRRAQPRQIGCVGDAERGCLRTRIGPGASCLGTRAKGLQDRLGELDRLPVGWQTASGLADHRGARRRGHLRSRAEYIELLCHAVCCHHQ